MSYLWYQSMLNENCNSIPNYLSNVYNSEETLRKKLEESDSLVKYYRDLLAKKEESMRNMDRNKSPQKNAEDQSMILLYQNKFSQVLEEKRKLEKELKEKKKKHSAVIEQLKKIDLDSTLEDAKHQKIMSNTDQELVKGLYDKITHLKMRVEKANKAEETEKQLGKQIMDLQSKLDIAKNEYASSVTEIEKYKTMIADLQKEIMKNSGQNCIQQMRLNELEVLLDDKEVALKNASGKLEEVTNELTVCSVSHIDKMNIMNNSISALEEKLNIAIVEKQSLESVISEKNSSINMLESQLKSAEAELAANITLLNKYKEDNNLAAGEVTYWTSKTGSLQYMLSQSRSIETSLRSEIDNKNSQILDLELKYEKELNLVKDLEDKLTKVVNRDINVGEVDDLKASVMRITNAFDLLKEHYDEVEKAYEESRNSNTVLSETLKKTTEELEAAKFQLSLMTGLQTDIKDLTEKLEKANATHAAELKHEKVQNSIMHGSIEFLANELEKVRNELKKADEAKSNSLELEQKLSDAIKTSETLTNDKTTLENSLKLADDERDKLKNEVKTLGDELDKTRCYLETNTANSVQLEKEHKFLSFMNATMEKEINTLKATLAEVNSDKDNLKSEVENLKTSLNDAQTSKCEMEIKLNTIINDLKKDNAYVSDTIETYKLLHCDDRLKTESLTKELKELSNFKDKFVAAEATANHLSSELITCQNDLSVTKSMLNKAEKNYSQCMLELSLLGIKNDKDCESLKKVNDENNSLKIERDSLKSALDAMKSSNDSDKKQINVATDELNKVIGEKQTLKSELSSLNDSFESMRKSYDLTYNLLTATKKDLNSALETIDKVEKEKADSVDKVKENDTLRDQLKRVSSEVIVQNKTLSKLTTQVAALETQLKQYDTPSTHVKTIMNKTLSELAEKVAPVPDIHSPENEEWEILESTSDFESVEKSDATM
uniref:Uncharacterized protein n=1 Tax=viral metagenome TaxID=1070528 RepID=A0A6C0E7C2_9ZZZZ